MVNLPPVTVNPPQPMRAALRFHPAAVSVASVSPLWSKSIQKTFPEFCSFSSVPAIPLAARHGGCGDVRSAPAKSRISALLRGSTRRSEKASHPISSSPNIQHLCSRIIAIFSRAASACRLLFRTEARAAAATMSLSQTNKHCDPRVSLASSVCAHFQQWTQADRWWWSKTPRSLALRGLAWRSRWFASGLPGCQRSEFCGPAAASAQLLRRTVQ